MFVEVIRLLIVRHGQSEWNAAGRWQGRADPPLTELGLHQARSAAHALPRLDLLAASTLQRARQTAQEIARVLEIPDIHSDDGLIERDAGEFSGLTREEINERFPGYLDEGRWPDGWEQDDELLERVKTAVRRIAGRPELAGGGTAVAIAHGGVIYALEGLFGLPHSRIANLEGRWFDVNGGTVVNVGSRLHLLDSAEETVPDQL